MKKTILLASAFGLLASVAPLSAQDTVTMTGSMAAADVGVSPMSGTSATDYVKLAADGDNYEIQSSKVALMRSKSPDVKSFARQMVSDHTETSKALMATLNNADRKIAPPSSMLSATNMSKLQLLKKAPRASFDSLYLQQQIQAHQMAWSLHKGYAMTGTDPALKQVASAAVPIVEMHLQHLKTMSGGTMGGM